MPGFCSYAQTVECNKRLAEFPLREGEPSFLLLSRVTPMLPSGEITPISNFGTTIRVTGSGGLFASGDFTVLGRYIMYNYNALSFLNYRNCDPRRDLSLNDGGYLAYQ